ncbi:helix-turn-helix domain-containing protein [Sphingomonas sp. GV3]|uniref:helix-turn-helix domain-containing protein n=1 Tax=Sphingomonas sp. GV3 TaxID=3040671 RepID=UPI0035B65039
MKLAAWRKREGKTQDWLAGELGCSQPYVSQIERAVNPIIPGPEIMERIFQVTQGAVEPNDFYELPRWRRALNAAMSIVTGRAA